MVRSAIHVPKDDRYYVESVARTLQLLVFLARAGRPLALRELVGGLGWSKPMVYRLIRTLEAHGALRKVAGQRYALGPAMVTIGQAALRAIELPRIAPPHLEQLHGHLGGETVNLAILDGDEIVDVEHVESRQPLGIRLGVGSRLPAYCTSMGHVLLAGLTDDEVEERLAHTRLERRGPRTLTSVPELLDRLKQVRAQGFALNDEELAVGLRGAGAPIFDHTGAVVAAINVSVPAARISREELIERIVPPLRAAAADISAELGATEPA